MYVVGISHAIYRINTFIGLFFGLLGGGQKERENKGYVVAFVKGRECLNFSTSFSAVHTSMSKDCLHFLL